MFAMHVQYAQVEGPLSFLCYSSHTCYVQVMYMTFQYLTVSCIPGIQDMYLTFLGKTADISVDSN